MTRIGDIGTAKVIETEESLAYYVTLALLKPNKVDSDFLVWLISSPEVKRNIWKRTLHIAFPKKINLGEINKIEMMVPNNEEQTKIGAFFKQLDDTIALHQQKNNYSQRTEKRIHATNVYLKIKKAFYYYVILECFFYRKGANMKKETFLKSLAEHGYNVMFGAKKAFCNV
ncbi:restriction endonuclease subunit S [Bacillus paranthracis]